MLIVIRKKENYIQDIIICKVSILSNTVVFKSDWFFVFFGEYLALEDVFICTTAQSYYMASFWPRPNTVHDGFSLRDTIMVSLVSKEHTGL